VHFGSDSQVIPQDASHGSTPEWPIEPGRTFRCGLFARCAGVHVDFHADRHFDNFRGLPGHSILPNVFGANFTPKFNLGPRPAPRKGGTSSVEQPRASLTADISIPRGEGNI